MNRLGAKLGFFLLIWYEVAVELGIGGDMAFVVTLVLTVLWAFALQLLGQAIQLLGPGAVRLLLQGGLWLALFWWFAPAMLRGLPFYAEAGVMLLLALIGMRCRQDHDGAKARGVRKDRSVMIVAAVIIGVAVCGWSLHAWGSFWPVIGYNLLLLLPLGVGWQLAPLAAARAADARVGDPGAFEDAGLSRER